MSREQAPASPTGSTATSCAQVRRREGRYLLRTNLTEHDPAKLWSYYLQLVAVEEAFKNLKGDLAIRPIFHQDEARIEAHIFIAFLAYCLHVTLGAAPACAGARAHPAQRAREVRRRADDRRARADHRRTRAVLTRYTQPEPELQLLLDKLKLELPAQPPPKITAAEPPRPTPV